MVTKDLGDRIRKLRQNTGLSQEKFALKIEMDRTYFASVEAERRNIDRCFAASFENGRIFADRVISAVNFYIYSIQDEIPLSYFLTIAPNLHFSIQAPHLIHFVTSMVCGFLTEPEMAPTGQTRAQAVQPLHLSASIS